MLRFLILCASLLVVPAKAATAETHKKVQSALDWELPMNACEQPQLRGKATDIIDANGQVTRFDIDSYELERFERKEKRWKKCEEKYRQRLEGDFKTLMNSVQYGLTPDQANTILGNMKLIQTVLLSPNTNVEN